MDQFWNRFSQQAVGCNMAYIRSILLATKYRRCLFLRKPKDDREIEKLIREISYTDFDTIRACSYTIRLIRYTKTFQACLGRSKQYTSQISHESLRNIIYKLYLDEIVPTKDMLMVTLASTEMSIPINLNEDLKVNGFMLKRLGNTRKALIVEDPVQIYNRMKYLNKVRNLRLLNRNFVYISYKDVNFSLAVSPHSDILSFKIHMDSIDGVKKQVLKFTEGLIPFLPESSVVVLDTKDVIKPNLLPGLYSSKNQMRQWLTRHGVPYEDNAHTAELYVLIEKFGANYKEKCDIQELLESHGFYVLRVPTELPSLSYFSPIFKQIQNLPYMTEAQYVSSIFGKYRRRELCLLEETLMKEEMRVYSEDVEIENIIDTVTMVASSTPFSVYDIKACGWYDPDLVPSYIILD